MSNKFIIIDGNSNDKDNIRTYMVKGEPGKDGADGYSPTITTSRSGKVTTITIVDEDGTKQAIINDGVSPTVTTSKSGKVTTITITDVNGTQTATINDGEDYKDVIYDNSGSHNSIYRGKDITDLFYDGTLSTQIAAGTFDDIFIGDYIIGQDSNRKYLVADINYRLHTGDTECTTPHVLMIPEKVMGTAAMNATDITTGAYVGSEMYTTNLAAFKTIIESDFGSGHILEHREHLQNAVTNGYESGGTWYNSTIELMSEKMVYGTDIFHNITHGTNIANNYVIDKSQLAIFKHRHDLIVAFDDNNTRQSWWLRDVVNTDGFARVNNTGVASNVPASGSSGVRPAFLIY